MLGLLGGLSVATDLGTGAPLEESLRRCVVATRLARAVGCADPAVSDVVYVSLLQHLGCTAYAHESAGLWGDDVAAVRLAFRTDFEDSSDVWRTFVSGIAETTGTSRPRVLATALLAGRKADERGGTATCEIARDASRQLGLPGSVQDALFHSLAQWNGKGQPDAAGPDIPLSTRIMQVASTAVLFALHGGVDVAVAQVRRRSGSYLDPDLVDVLVSRAEELLADIDDVDAYGSVLDAEPDPVRYVDERELEDVARTFGQLVDLKSPWLHGHSTGVGDLAADAALAMGLAEHATVRVAGYLHDLGRVAVSSRIWDKPGPLSTTERDQARLHPYHTERILSRVPALAEAAKIAGQHHERCDGSGYHRGVLAAQLTMPSRVLAAADAYRTLVEGRPHRPAVPAGDAAVAMKGEARAGRLDAEAVAAVLQAAGVAGGARQRSRPCGLTQRQVEVLRLVAVGLSNREIARRLVISPRTAEHHVQDIYLRIGATSRAAAALFAMEHGLIERSG
jgi:HD-GYP domain-containing protein (c-di-GMP phosphodiesterase class II)